MATTFIDNDYIDVASSRRNFYRKHSNQWGAYIFDMKRKNIKLRNILFNITYILLIVALIKLSLMLMICFGAFFILVSFCFYVPIAMERSKYKKFQDDMIKNKEVTYLMGD